MEVAPSDCRQCRHPGSAGTNGFYRRRISNVNGSTSLVKVLLLRSKLERIMDGFRFFVDYLFV